MIIKIENVREFFSTQASHFDIPRLNSSFEHAPHYIIYRKRLKRLVESRDFGRRERIQIFDLLEDLIAFLTKNNLARAKELLISDIGGRVGSFRIENDEFIFKNITNENLLNQSLLGNSVHAFFMKVLIMLHKRMAHDQEALELYLSLNDRINKLVELQKNKGDNIQTPKNQTISEFIIAKSSEVMADLNKISRHSLDAGIKHSIDKHKSDLDDLLGEEMKALNERISDALIFLIQLLKLQKSSRQYKEKCKKSLNKMSRELLSIAYLVSCAEDVAKGQKIYDSELLENIRLNLFFAFTLLPYNDIFMGRYQNALENKLMYLSHLAQYLCSFNNSEIGFYVIPETSTFAVEGLESVQGKKVVEVFEDLKTHLEDKDQSVARKFFMQIELHFRAKNLSEEEGTALISLKKLLAQRLLEQLSDCTIKTLYALKELVSDTGDHKAAYQLYVSEDVVLLFRETCHSLEQLLNLRKKWVSKIYKKMQSPLLYYQKEKMPKSRYRRRTNGVLTKIKSFHGRELELGDQLLELLNSLCEVCDKNLERSASSCLMDKVIRKIAPQQGGLVDILDDPQKLRLLMEDPSIKNQSINRNSLMQLLKLTKTILAK